MYPSWEIQSINSLCRSIVSDDESETTSAAAMKRTRGIQRKSGHHGDLVSSLAFAHRQAALAATPEEEGSVGDVIEFQVS